MSRSKALILTGAAIGFFAGSSMGIAAGGTAYNAALFLTPLGAFIGWLVSNSSLWVNRQPNLGAEPHVESEEMSLDENGSQEKEVNQRFLHQIIWSALALTAIIWNFHIDLLKMVGLLPTFVKQPLLFIAMCIVVSVFFPPFLVVYFFAWLGANHFGLSEETDYRAVIR